MSRGSSLRENTQPLSLALRIDEACDRFDYGRRGTRPEPSRPGAVRGGRARRALNSEEALLA
jgi:hypothetical protein